MLSSWKTIEDIDMIEKTTSEKDSKLSDIDSIWIPVHDLDNAENDV